MRVFISVSRAPIGRFLQVEDFIGGEIASSCLFAVGIGDLPMLAGKRFAVFAQQVELGDGSIVFAILCIQTFEAEETGFDRSVEFNFLPSVSGLQGACG